MARKPAYRKPSEQWDLTKGTVYRWIAILMGVVALAFVVDVLLL